MLKLRRNKVVLQDDFKSDIGGFKYQGLAFPMSKHYQWFNDDTDQLIWIKINKDFPIVFKGIVSSSTVSFHSVALTNDEIMILNTKVQNFKVVNEISDFSKVFNIFTRND